MDISNMRKILKELRFPEYHSNILLILVNEQKYLDAKQIEEKSKVPLSRVYSILLELEEDKLIKKLPGAVTRYSCMDNKSIIEAIRKKNERRLDEEKNKLSKNLDMLSKGFFDISKSIDDDFRINYFSDDNEYWKKYNSLINKLRKGDVYRIINSKRIEESMLLEEIKDKRVFSMVELDRKLRKRGVITHHITNPKALVENMLCEFKDKEKVKQAIKKMLMEFQEKDYIENHWITLTPAINNMILVILNEDVFMEFYSSSTSVIKSAIHISSKKMAEDFSNWFLLFDNGKTHDGKKDYLEFEKEIKKWEKALI